MWIAHLALFRSGTLIAWSSLIAVTGFARVPVLEAVRLTMGA